MYDQIVTPNLDPYLYDEGKQLNTWLGWCLLYVQTSYGAGWAGSTAWDAWSYRVTNKHENDWNLPSGVYVPIWFSGYYGMGHVAIYKDGTIWSTPISSKPFADTWSSIQEVEEEYGVTYVGWSEDIGGTQVINFVAPAPATPSQGGDDMAEKITVDTSRILSNGVLARNGIAGRGDSLDGSNGGDALIGQDLTNGLVQQLFLSDEARQWRDSSEPNSISGINARLGAADSMLTANQQLNQKIEELNAKVAELGANPTKAELQEKLDEIARLTAELKQQPTLPIPPVGNPTDVDLTGALKALWNSIRKYLHVK